MIQTMNSSLNQCAILFLIVLLSLFSDVLQTRDSLYLEREEALFFVEELVRYSKLVRTEEIPSKYLK